MITSKKKTYLAHKQIPFRPDIIMLLFLPLLPQILIDQPIQLIQPKQESFLKTADVFDLGMVKPIMDFQFDLSILRSHPGRAPYQLLIILIIISLPELRNNFALEHFDLRAKVNNFFSSLIELRLQTALDLCRKSINF